MTRSTRIALAAALLVGGATIATAQNGPPTGGYPPATKNPNLYGYYGYHHRHYGYHHRYYAYHPRYHGCPPDWTIQGGVCKPYRHGPWDYGPRYGYWR